MSVVATMNSHTQTPAQPMDAETKSRLNSVPAWGSYLYQNFLLPAFSPTASMSEWLNLNTPFAALTPRAAASNQQQNQQQVDYFGQGWGKADDVAGMEPAPQNTMPFNLPPTQPNFQSFQFAPQPPQMQQAAQYPAPRNSQDAGPSSFYPQYNYSGPSISTSLLMNQFPVAQGSYAAPIPASQAYHRPSIEQASHRTSVNSLNVVDGQLTHSPSPMTSHQHTPHQSPKRAGKRRFDSLDSEDHEHDSDPEPDVPEGVERDGMIWGMKVDAYRALSARERKRVRNRISARTFRAKRKEHLSSLEENMNVKDLKLKLATEESTRLKQEVADLRRRLAQYE